MNRSILFALVFGLSWLGAMCNPEPVPPDPDPYQPTVDPQPGDPDDGTPCGAMCSRYAVLECDEAKPTDAGAKCEDWCRNAESEGIPLAGKVECSRAADTCKAVTNCSRER